MRVFQAGVTCRLLSNQRPAPTPGQNDSLLSGLSRRVSNLFSIVASSGGLISRLPPHRGENTVNALTLQCNFAHDHPPSCCLSSVFYSFVNLFDRLSFVFSPNNMLLRVHVLSICCWTISWTYGVWMPIWRNM